MIAKAPSGILDFVLNQGSQKGGTPDMSQSAEILIVDDDAHDLELTLCAWLGAYWLVLNQTPSS